MGWKDAPVKGAKKNKWEDAQVLGTSAPTTGILPPFLEKAEQITSQPGKTFEEANRLKLMGHPLAGQMAALRGGLEFASQPISLSAEYLKTPSTPVENIPTLVNPYAPIFGAIRGTAPVRLAVGAVELIPKAASAVAGGISSITAEPLLNLADKEAGKQFTQTVETAAPFALPMFGKGIRAGTRAIAKALPREAGLNLVAKAGKFSGSPEQILKKSEIAIRENINPSNIKALERLETAVSQIDKDVEAYGKSTDFIKTDNALRYIEPLIEKVQKRELTPERAVEEIRSQVEQIYKERGEEIPADLAHELKKGIYKREKAAYETQEKTGKLPDLSTEVEMKVARGILGEWKKLYPETESLLSRQSDLLSIRKDIRRTVAAEMKRSNLPNALLAAISPKWWLMKMVATNKSLEYNLGRLLYRARGEKPGVKTKGTEPPPYGSAPPFGGGFTPPTPTYGPGAPPFTAPPISTAAPKSIKDIFPNYPGNKTIELPRDILPIQFKSSGEAISYGKSATPEQIAQLQTLRETAVSQSQLPGEFDLKQQYGQQGAFYREALESSPKSTEEVMTPKSGTAPEFIEYRKYISNGGNLNFSDWKAKGKPGV